MNLKNHSLFLLLVACYLLLPSSLSGAGKFQVESFKISPTDLAARRYELIDVNGNPCALIKVQTDLKDLQFMSMLLEKYVDKQNGEYWVYVQEGTRRLKIRKEGLMPLDYSFGYKLEGSTVYKMQLTANGMSALKEISVNIITKPIGARVFIDGKEKGNGRNIVTSVGKHQLKIVKDGYKTLETAINVTATKTLFDFTLKEIENISIEVDTRPSGATVYIDNIKLGATPLSNFYPEGKYTIRIEKSGYATISEQIEIKSPEVVKSYQLIAAEAILTINTQKNAEVYLNNNRIYDLKDLKLEPQICNILVKMPGATDISRRVILKSGDNKVLDLYANVETGKALIAVIPKDAEITLSSEYNQEYTSTGKKIFADLPTGKYSLKVSKSGYQDFNSEIFIEKNETVNKSIKLDLVNNYAELKRNSGNEPTQNEKKVKLNLKQEDKSYFWWWVGGGAILAGGAAAYLASQEDDTSSSSEAKKGTVVIDIPIP